VRQRRQKLVFEAVDALSLFTCAALCFERRFPRRSIRFFSVISRAIFDAPIIVPAEFRTGDTLSEISTRRPSLVSRSVSK
jgi:hypothetical protein